MDPNVIERRAICFRSKIAGAGTVAYLDAENTLSKNLTVAASLTVTEGGTLTVGDTEVTDDSIVLSPDPGTIACTTLNSTGYITTEKAAVIDYDNRGDGTLVPKAYVDSAVEGTIACTALNSTGYITTDKAAVIDYDNRGDGTLVPKAYVDSEVAKEAGFSVGNAHAQLGGVRLGSTLSRASVTVGNTSENYINYNLPTGSTTTLGGIMLPKDGNDVNHRLVDDGTGRVDVVESDLDLTKCTKTDPNNNSSTTDMSVVQLDGSHLKVTTDNNGDDSLEVDTGSDFTFTGDMEFQGKFKISGSDNTGNTGQASGVYLQTHDGTYGNIQLVSSNDGGSWIDFAFADDSSYDDHRGRIRYNKNDGMTFWADDVTRLTIRTDGGMASGGRASGHSFAENPKNSVDLPEPISSVGGTLSCDFQSIGGVDGLNFDAETYRGVEINGGNDYRSSPTGGWNKSRLYQIFDNPSGAGNDMYVTNHFSGGGGVHSYGMAYCFGTSTSGDSIVFQGQYGSTYGMKVGIGNRPGAAKLFVHGSFGYSGDDLSPSDDRLKHNERPIDDALSSIRKVRPKRYFKTLDKYEPDHNLSLDDSGLPTGAGVNGEALKMGENVWDEVGVIAQELNEIEELKHLVTPPSDDTMTYSISYRNLSMIHLKAFQELDAIVQTLLSENESLKARVSALEAST